MLVKVEWSARVRATEPIDALEEFSSECKRSMIDSELIPDTALVQAASFDWQHHAEVVIRWDTQNVMALTENYVPAGTDRSAALD